MTLSLNPHCSPGSMVFGRVPPLISFVANARTHDDVCLGLDVNVSKIASLLEPTLNVETL